MNCVSTAEAAVAQGAVVAYALKSPVHRWLARRGVVANLDPVGRDVRTIAFLRSLDLDSVEILGSEVVEAAIAWNPAGSAQLTESVRRWRLAASARPIGSQSLITTQ
jgi:hypothetical protein